MKKTTIILCISFAIFLISTLCIISFRSNNQSNQLAQITSNEEYVTYSYISTEQKKAAENNIVFGHMKSEITSKDLKSSADNIAIVLIVSLDYANAEYDNIVGNTYGKMLINSSIKGNLSSGDIVEYCATGGYLTIAEWEKYQPVASNEKRDYLRAQTGIQINKETSYIHTHLRNCVDVEEGSTYLAYFTYNKDMNKYKIIGLQNGLMKLDIPNNNSRVSVLDLDYNNTKIFNNKSQEYENLQDYITTNITSITE